MNTLFDNPVVGTAVLVLAGMVLFVPTVVAHFRRLQDFRSVTALNALTFLMVICFLVPGWLFWGSASPLLLCGTVAIWLAATAWAIAGGRRDS